MNNRFKMTFNNSGYIPHQVNTFASNNGRSNLPSIGNKSGSRSVQFNSPMIERVHRAKPGCSACGKKIA
jgi:hypothetical protein